MADEKIIQYIGFQQGINLGDNYTVAAGTTVKAGGARKGLSRMQDIHEMKKQAAADGLSLAEYMKKLKAEMEEAERAMQEMDSPNAYTQPDIQEAEVVDVTPEPVNEPNENEKKRAELKRTNEIFKSAVTDTRVDLLAIYNFIKEHFVSAITQQCEWVAVFCYFNNNKKLLSNTEESKFIEQMMNPEWFGELKNDKKKACTHNGMKEYSFIYYEKNADNWDIEDKPDGSRASSRGLRLIYNRYSELDIEGKNLTFLIESCED